MSKRDKQGKFVQRSLSQQAWIQFRSNRLAICGLVVNLEEICCSGFYGERAIHFLPVFVRFWLPSLQAVCLVLLRDFTAGKLIMSSCALWIW